MPINSQLIANTTPHSQHVSNLKAHISFAPAITVYHRDPMFTYQALRKLFIKMRFSDHHIDDLATLMSNTVANAYDRGLFVICNAACRGLPNNIDSPEALLTTLRGQDDPHYTPHLWYTEDNYRRSMRNDRWPSKVINYVAPLLTRHARLAFANGLKVAATALVVAPVTRIKQ